MSETTAPLPYARPHLVSAAIAVLWLYIALVVVGSFQGTPISLVAVVPIALLLRGVYLNQAWTAFGGAILVAAIAFMLCLGILQGRTAGGDVSRISILIVAVAYGALGLLLLAAGRALARHRPDHVRWGWIGLSAALMMFYIGFRPYVIPTGSMEDTLLIGDHILTPTYGSRHLSRGDLAVFRMPIDRQQVSVKRVVATGGDHVKIVNKHLIVNGVAQQERSALNRTDFIDSYRDNFPSQPNATVYRPAEDMLAHNVSNGEVIVPPGHYFVLGDNRDFSLDSRYFGFVDQADILAKPLFVYYSVKRTEGKPDNVRWNRLFTPVH